MRKHVCTIALINVIKVILCKVFISILILSKRVSKCTIKVLYDWLLQTE